MIATRFISLRLCFLLLSCVTVLIYSEISRLEAMTIFDERTMAQRHDRALTSTPDQLSTSLEERGAPVAVEEEAGILSRFVSYLKPSYLWKKLASSRIMRFFMPHIYLRHSSDIPAAGGILFMKARADKVEHLFGSKEFQTWSKYFTNAFPDNPKVAADNMVLTLVRYHIDKFVDSIPKTKFDNGELAFGAPFEAALIRYIVKTKKIPESEPEAIRLEESMGKLIKRLKEDDKSKSIGERLEQAIRGDGISNSKENLVNVQPVQKLSPNQNGEGKLEIGIRDDGISNSKENLVNVDNVQPVQKLSPNQNGISKPIISFTSASDEQVVTAFKLLQDAGLDKVSEGIFNSQEFQKWSKLIAKTFPDEPHEGAGIMLITLAKVDKDKLVKSIPTTNIENSEFTFGVRFKDALIDYIAIAKDTDDLANDLESALLDLTRSLSRKDIESSIAVMLEGEVSISRIKNKKNLVDVFQDESVRMWVSSLSKKDDKEFASIMLDHKFNQQGITNEQIGDAISQKPDALTLTALNGVALCRLSSLLDNHKLNSVTQTDELLKTWFQEAMVLNVYYEDALPKLQTVFSNQQIISFCVPHALQNSVFQKPANAILNVFIRSWKETDDLGVLKALSLPSFSFGDPMSRFWIQVMEDRHKELVGSVIANIIFQHFSNDIPELIANRGVNIYPTYRSISDNLERLSKEKQTPS